MHKKKSLSKPLTWSGSRTLSGALIKSGPRDHISTAKWKQTNMGGKAPPQKRPARSQQEVSMRMQADTQSDETVQVAPPPQKRSAGGRHEDAGCFIAINTPASTENISHTSDIEPAGPTSQANTTKKASAGNMMNLQPDSSYSPQIVIQSTDSVILPPRWHHHSVIQSPDSSYNPQIGIQSPDRVIQSPDRVIQSPDSSYSHQIVIQSPDSVIQSPDRVFQSPDSVIQSPDSSYSPQIVIQSPDRVLQSPDSVIQTTDSIHSRNHPSNRQIMLKQARDDTTNSTNWNQLIEIVKTKWPSFKENSRTTTLNNTNCIYGIMICMLITL